MNTINVRSSDSQLHKLKSAVKNQTWVSWRMNGNNLPRELLLTASQKTKLKNAFENKVNWYKVV